MAARLTQLARLFVEPPETLRAPPDDDGSADAAVHWLRSAPPAGPAVADAAESAPHVVPAPAIHRPPTVAVICSPRDLRVAGAAAGLALAHVARARCAVVAEWTGTDQPRGMDRSVSPSARRVAALFRSRGHAAHATGRLVRVALPVGEQGAAAEAYRALAHLAAALPTVLALAGPRGEVLHDLVARHDLTLLVQRPAADDDVAALAAADLTAAGATVRRVQLVPSPAAAFLVRSGVALVAPLRPAFLAAIDGLA